MTPTMNLSLEGHIAVVKSSKYKCDGVELQFFLQVKKLLPEVTADEWSTVPLFGLSAKIGWYLEKPIDNTMKGLS